KLTEDTYRDRLRGHPPLNGMPIVPSRKAQRPGTVSLQDAARVAEDFIVLRTTRQAVRDLLQQFDFTTLAERFSLEYLAAGQHVLIVSGAATRHAPEGILDVYDANVQRRLELQIDMSEGYRNRAGHEYPVAGLRVLRVWEAGRPGEEPREHVL